MAPLTMYMTPGVYESKPRNHRDERSTVLTSGSSAAHCARLCEDCRCVGRPHRGASCWHPRYGVSGVRTSGNVARTRDDPIRKHPVVSSCGGGR